MKLIRFSQHFINVVSRCMFRLVTIHFQVVPGSMQVMWNCLLWSFVYVEVVPEDDDTLVDIRSEKHR